MTICGFLPRLAAFFVAALMLFVGASQPARGSLGCPDYPVSQPFLPWLDLAPYTLVPNGGLEDGSNAWSLSGGATVVPGNERFFVRAPGDGYSLSLPSGSSATTSTTCVGVLEGTVRLFVMNTGSVLSTLKVEVLYNDAFGTPRAHTIGFLIGTSRWQPTLPTLFLSNLLHPPLVTAGKVDVAFRFTPQGSRSGWRIDDLYVDPFKGT